MHAFDVLADPVRRRILEILGEGEHASGEVTEMGAMTNSFYPAVSPDGELVAYGADGRLVVQERASGRVVREVPTPGDRGLLPSWSPDGQYVCFLVDEPIDNQTHRTKPCQVVVTIPRRWSLGPSYPRAVPTMQCRIGKM